MVGVLFTPFVTRRSAERRGERRQEMADLLDDRVRTVQSEFVENVSDWSARRLSTLELFTLAAEFWTGEEYDDPERLLRTVPAVDSQRRGDEL